MPEHSVKPESPPQTGSALRLRAVEKHFGGRQVVDIDDLGIGAYGIEGLIGPNGAGKTTLTKLITGALSADAGTITYNNGAGEVDITGTPSHRIARLGLVKSNQVIQDFETLTIRDSMLLAVARPEQERFYKVFGRSDGSLSAAKDEIDWYLDYFHFEDPDGHALSAGEKKLLDIIRCLLVKPRFLLLDEPTAGLPDDETNKVADLLRAKVADGELSVLIIEHDLDLIWRVCDYIHFMAEGQILLQGEPDEVRASTTVIEKYLGTDHA